MTAHPARVLLLRVCLLENRKSFLAFDSIRLSSLPECFSIHVFHYFTIAETYFDASFDTNGRPETMKHSPQNP